MYTCSWFTSLYSRNEHSIIKQIDSNKNKCIKTKREREISDPGSHRRPCILLTIRQHCLLSWDSKREIMNWTSCEHSSQSDRVRYRLRAELVVYHHWRKDHFLNCIMVLQEDSFWGVRWFSRSWLSHQHWSCRAQEWSMDSIRHDLLSWWQATGQSSESWFSMVVCSLALIWFLGTEKINREGKGSVESF